MMSYGVVHAQAVPEIGNTSIAYDISGKPLASKSADAIKGSQMLNTEWGKGLVRFTNGNMVKDVDLQFNLVSNELYFLRNNERYVFSDTVKEFMISYEDDGQAHSAFFRRGYPHLHKSKGTAFYEVVQDGKRAQLLKITRKQLVEENNYGAGKQRKYVHSYQWFVYDVQAGQLSKLKKDKSSLINSFPSLKEALEKFFERSPAPRNEEDMVAFITQLNAD